MRKLNKNNKT